MQRLDSVPVPSASVPPARGARSRPVALRTALAALAVALLGSCAVSTMPGVRPPRAMPAARAALQPEYRLFYDALVDYGDWVLIEPYGFVFRPRVDPLWWRPYYDGYWVPTDVYGWVWSSADPFGWATDHYGRWFYDDFQGWVWMPGLEWGPAWVTWRMGGDYVSWAPLPFPGVDGWSDRVPHGPWLYAATGDLAHADLRARARTAAEVGAAALKLEPVERETVRDGVRIPLGPPIERVERAHGFPLPRVRLEELIPDGAATLPAPTSAVAPDSLREPVLLAPIAEIRRAGEQAARDIRDITGRQSPPPLRVPVLRAFGDARRGAPAPKGAAPDTARARR